MAPNSASTILAPIPIIAYGPTSSFFPPRIPQWQSYSSAFPFTPVTPGNAAPRGRGLRTQILLGNVAPFFQVIALPFLYDGIEKRCVGTVLGSREAVTSLRSARFLPGTEGGPRTEGFRSGKGRRDVSSDFLERGEEATLVSLLSSSLNR